ncbi:MAG: malto-oligosyltrehalose trehalohydrolase [Gammaproteobacteria bacterium]
MIFRHAMPFGATVLDSGGVRFRLWAPSVERIALRISPGPAGADFGMRRDDAGWHCLDLPSAGAGTRYAFVLDDGSAVPDPASRCNPDGVHAASAVVDPAAFEWPDEQWRGRPWEQAVIYELHVGTFSPQGTFAGVEDRLDYLAGLGVTALEIMPVAAFPGHRGWGYDGVLPFAPHPAYGTPEQFKHLVAAAHARGLMVILDVVYNHFGPDGNYLHAYCPEFFNPAHHTPWGAAINFDGARSRTVRDFFVHNARYWIGEYQLDGLRLDAIHAICDESAPDIVEEILAALRADAGAAPRGRQVHVILENDRNQARYLAASRPRTRGACGGVAQWNDDMHHACHVIATGEGDGYYADYAQDPFAPLARCLGEGFAWQGEASPHRGGERRGEPSGGLRPGAFVNFLQTHDQIGNRAMGERLSQLAPAHVLHALTAMLLLAPQPPLLFMGEEFAAGTPFLYFCDFDANPALARAVTTGRRREFAGFAQFADPAARERIPDPNDEASFLASRLDWNTRDDDERRESLALYRALLARRHEQIVPRLAGIGSLAESARVARPGPHALHVQWTLGDGSRLTLVANLGPSPIELDTPPAGERLFATANVGTEVARLPGWAVLWHIAKKVRR